MTSPCAACTRGCCHHYSVVVTGHDIWAISRALGLAPEQFLVVTPQHTPNSRGFCLDSSGRTFDLALDKQTGGAAEARACVFWLSLPGGVGRCGVYAVRPHVCQTYPAVLRQDQLLRRDDVLCPDDAWRGDALAHPIWRQRLEAMYVEFDLYALAVARWNAHVRAQGGAQSAGQYLAYVMNFYARLAPIRARLGPESWAALCAEWSAGLQRGVSPWVVDVPALAPWAGVLTDIRAVAESFFPSDYSPPTVPPSPPAGAEPGWPHEGRRWEEARGVESPALALSRL